MGLISLLRIHLGIIKKTDAIEATRAALQKEYDEYNEYAKSKELARYLELKEFVSSPDFALRKKEIMRQKFSSTAEYSKQQRYLELKKKPRIKTYLAVSNSQQLQACKTIEQSAELKEYIGLEQYLHSNEFLQLQASMPSKEFKQHESYQKVLRHKELSNSSALKNYHKFIQSENYKIYTEMADSAEVKEYFELEKYLAGDAFLKVRDYMALSASKKWEASDEYAKLTEYKTLYKSEKIRWYFSLEGTHKFDEIKRWKMTFEDDFNQAKLSPQWLTKYYYGETIIKDTYSLFNDQHFVTDGANLSIGNSMLKIITQKNNKPVEGKAWHAKNGFYTRSFEYTSGLINTGKAFRQKYGRFEVKAKLNKSASVTHTGYLLGNSALPQINLFKSGKNILSVGMYQGMLAKGKVKKSCSPFLSKRFTNDYYLFAIEWTPGKIIWKINDLVAHTINTNLAEPLYLSFGSGIYTKNVDESTLPVTLDIDWVRCYEETTN